MSEPKTIDVETVPPAQGGQSMGLQVSQAGAVGRALGMDELKANLDFIRDVMRNVMKEGQDYGKIPGTGDKPTLLQPGAQKLLMTFQLTEYVKKEVLSEYPGMHRVYEFTVAVKALNGKEWDGVGTCSTFEKKYRYRQGGRKCPQCGKPTILSAKKGPPGYFCWAKKGGCGAKFNIDDPRIGNQSEGQVENPDIADQWNTVRKIAFKRALVAAAINATNTSELWTQDLDDKGDPGEEGPQGDPGPRRGGQTQAGKPAAAPAPRTAPGPAQKTVPLATVDTRGRFLRQWADLDVLKEFCVAAGKILPTETVEHIPLRFVPVTKKQNDALLVAFRNFENGEPAAWPFQANPEAPEAPDSAKKEQIARAPKKRDPEWFWDILVTVPHKGEKRDEYLKSPDTIGSLYQAMKSGDEEAQKRLWGFAKQWNPEPRTVGDKTYQPSEADHLFREALDAFVEHEEKHGGDTDPPPPPEEELAY